MAEKKVKKTESVDEKKDKALTDAIHLIEKQFGKGSIMKLGDRVAVDIDVIPTKITDFGCGTGNRGLS